MNLLSAFDVAVLRAAQLVLHDLDQAATAAAWEIPRLSYARDLGRLAGTADMASDNVFQVLNIASSYCSDEAAAAGIKAGRPETAEAAKADLRGLLELDGPRGVVA